MSQWAKLALGNELLDVWRKCCGSGVNICRVTEETVDWGWPLSGTSDCPSACFIFSSTIISAIFIF